MSIRKRGHTWAKEQESEKETHDTVPVIRIPNIGDRLNLDDLLHLRGVSAEALQESAVTKNWILFVGSNGNPDRIGDSVLIEEDRKMVFASFLMGITSKAPSELLPAYLALWLRIHNVHETFSKASQQTTGLANFCWGAVKKLPVRFPKRPEEQQAIIDFIRQAADAAGAAQRKLAAAQRLKTSLMQQLFTRGIPGRHTRFKQNKIGGIPETWDLKRGRECFQLGSYSGPAPTTLSPQGDSLYLKVDDFNTEGNEKVLQSAAVRFDASKNPDLQLFPPGAIAFAKRGAALLKNRVRLLGVTSAVDPNLMVMMPKQDVVSTKFMFYFLTHYKLGRLCEDAGIPQLNNRDLYPKLFPVPPQEEQTKIVALLENADEVIRTSGAELKSARRLKTSLLQNLLTGKVRIRMED